MATPCVLFTSCSSFSANNLVKDILNQETVPEEKSIVENIRGYEWNVDTKYYTAIVDLCVTEERTIGDQQFADNLQAFVVYFDAENDDSFKKVKLWMPYLDQIDPEIKILVCDRCLESSVINRLAAQTWCIDNGFELVELNPDSNSDSELEDDFVETTGLARIVQALHAHTWPNLVMKDTRHTVSPYIRQLMKEEHEKNQTQRDNDTNEEISDRLAPSHDEKSHDSDKQCKHSIGQNGVDDSLGANIDKVVQDIISETSEISVNEPSGEDAGESDEADKKTDVASGGDDKEKDKAKKKQPSKEERLESLLPSEDQGLFEALASEDPEEESFEKLFEQFAQMKEKASVLPLDERKKYAEHVAIAFWRAMGGDEDEVGDLDSD
ncbi:alpha- and gamma-adaptin-binding protein p34-like [Mya arenaria]|uniref:alpha- and gamma-adaptin-binding protein p34-like n=1 Tax=Mya arenaria TaxID=6604 RepID=UPI0022E1EE81|nr:alpha- and gamma-adaptin-binding protein p34-like [Mya arenaria]